VILATGYRPHLPYLADTAPPGRRPQRRVNAHRAREAALGAVRRESLIRLGGLARADDRGACVLVHAVGFDDLDLGQPHVSEKAGVLVAGERTATQPTYWRDPHG